MIAMEITKLFNNTEAFSGSILQDEPLSKHTTMRVGGKACLFLQPDNADSFVYALRQLKTHSVPYFLLGGGSNVIMPDCPEFVVLSTKKLCSAEIAEKNERGAILKLGAGASWGRVCNLCKDNCFLGFESFSGLPGTVGGALYMNATCFGFSACDNLVNVRYFDIEADEIRTYEKNADDWGYKRSPFQDSNRIVLEANFCVKSADVSKEAVAEIYAKTLQERVGKGHFSAPSAGSVFKNDSANGIVAGRLIDECGLKGLQVGGARVADWHGNFIINTGNATASDIKALVAQIKSVVKEKKGISLDCEIIFA